MKKQDESIKETKTPFGYTVQTVSIKNIGVCNYIKQTVKK